MVYAKSGRNYCFNFTDSQEQYLARLTAAVVVVWGNVIINALMQYKNPANRSLVLEGLKIAGRMDLVGFGPKCLLRPERDRRKESGRNPSGGDRRKPQNQGRKPAKKTIRNTHKKK